MGKTKLVTSNLEQKVGGACVSLLLLMLLVLFCPTVTNASSALNGSGYNKPAWQPSEPSAVSLSLEEMPEMEIVPRIGGEVGVSSARLRVSTSSNAGYKLYVNTKDRTNAMVNMYDQSSASIAALSTPTAASGFKPNTWGYALTDSTVDGSTIYQPMPVASSLAYDTKALAGEHYLSFAASIDNSLPAGSYVNTVTISAIANPALITGMMELTYMQDMTSSICKATIGRDGNTNQNTSGSYIITPGSEPTKQLIDIRDGKEYWVAKLADGNCWMTQNLALDLKANQTLTNTNTDLNSKTSWVIPTTTETSVPAKKNASTADYYTMRSWNLGEYVSIHPSGRTGCHQSGGTVDFNSLSNGQTFDICSEALQNIKNWQPLFDASTTNFASTTDSNSKTYDAHYLIGNYYQFNTATAGSGGDNQVSTTTNLIDAKDSICPKNWRLPTSGRQSNNIPADRTASFYRLFYAYNYPAAQDYKYLYMPGTLSSYNNTSLLYGIINGAHQDVDLSPIYITRAGYLYLPNGLNNAVTNGFLWSSTVAERATHAYYANFWGCSGEMIMPNYSFSRHFGLNVRCLAK